MTYKLTNTTDVIHVPAQTRIPDDLTLPERQAYEAWLAEGNTPLPADPEPVYTPDTEALRKAAYREESDPLFFKWQRGEATEAEWIAAVNAIKTRYHEPT